MVHRAKATAWAVIPPRARRIARDREPASDPPTIACNTSIAAET